MLIYQVFDKKTTAKPAAGSRGRGLKPSTSALTRINAKFLRDLGFKVQQYKKPRK